MFKKNLFTYFICLAFFSINALDGFDVKFNKFINFYFIDQRLDWGNLYIEGVDADFKAAVLAQRKLKSGRFDQKIHSIIPADFSQTDQEWKKAKEDIAHLIGHLPSLKESTTWKNSSKSVDSLLQDAQQVSSIFKQDFQTIAKHTQAVANFGPGNLHIVKTQESLEGKANRDAVSLGISKEEAVAKIGDALRGTIIVDDLNKIPALIAEMIRYADNKGARISFKNLWAEERDSGYVGIHAKILYPLSDLEEKEGQVILAEMQIHLENMVDGTEISVKERAHSIYENVRVDEKQGSADLSAASKLLFLVAMEEALAHIER